MEHGNEIALLFGTIISLLLSVVAYFIRQLHGDFRKMEKDLMEVKLTTQLIKTEFKSNHDLLNQKVEFLDKRITIMEAYTFKNNRHE